MTSELEQWKRQYTVSDEYVCAKDAASVRHYGSSGDEEQYKCFECGSIGTVKHGLIRTKLDGLLRI